MTPLEAVVVVCSLYVAKQMFSAWIDRNRVSLKGPGYSVDAPNVEIARQIMEQINEMRAPRGSVLS